MPVRPVRFPDLFLYKYSDGSDKTGVSRMTFRDVLPSRDENIHRCLEVDIFLEGE